jgi:hypothetical protein
MILLNFVDKKRKRIMALNAGNLTIWLQRGWPGPNFLAPTPQCGGESRRMDRGIWGISAEVNSNCVE